jgi:NAD(P)-dependent dehydrogenase (short-subunit alcohol dehydrogenase family)
MSTTPSTRTGQAALIVGTGSGISASVARALHGRGWRLALASRRPEGFAELATSTRAVSVTVDASLPAEVERCFAEVDRSLGQLDLVMFNASYRTRGPFVDLDATEVERTLQVGAYGGFLVAQAAARRMLPAARGAIFLTGASASVKGYAQSAPFAMAKFALRGLAQSMARELQPKGIHVAHFVIDGGVRNTERGRRESPDDVADSLLDPDAIAQSYLHVLDQPRSAWTSEVELRPWVERF